MTAATFAHAAPADKFDKDAPTSLFWAPSHALERRLPVERVRAPAHISYSGMLDASLSGRSTPEISEALKALFKQRAIHPRYDAHERLMERIAFETGTTLGQVNLNLRRAAGLATA